MFNKQIVFIVIVFLSMTGCSDNRNIEKADNINITIDFDEIADLYLISAGLVFDFENQIVVNNKMNNSIYEKTIEYFKSSKASLILQRIQFYVDIYNDEIPFLFPLIMQDDSSVELTQLLREFYVEANAEDFFSSIYNKHMLDNENIFSDYFLQEVKEHILLLEKFVNNKDIVSMGKETKYNIIISPFLSPLRASMVTNEKDDYIELNVILSPYSLDGNGEVSIKQTLETIGHEILHFYINEEVAKNKEFIENKAFEYNFNKNDFGGKTYENMEWHRIIDENIVRVVQILLYEEILGEEEKAIK